MRRLLLAAVLAALPLAPTGQAWTWPAAGAVLQPFLFRPGAPPPGELCPLVPVAVPRPPLPPVAEPAPAPVPDPAPVVPPAVAPEAPAPVAEPAPAPLAPPAAADAPAPAPLVGAAPVE